MKTNLILMSLMSIWLFTSCAYKAENAEAIHFGTGGGITDDFRASEVYSIMGKTYTNDALTKLSNKDIEYLNSLKSEQKYIAFANNILITLYWHDKEITKEVTWHKNNTSLKSIASALNH